MAAAHAVLRLGRSRGQGASVRRAGWLKGFVSRRPVARAMCIGAGLISIALAPAAFAQDGGGGRAEHVRPESPQAGAVERSAPPEGERAGPGDAGQPRDIDADSDEAGPASPDPVRDGRPYPVSEVVLRYARPHPQHEEVAPLRALLDLRVPIVKTPAGYIAQREGGDRRIGDRPRRDRGVRIRDIAGDETAQVWSSAIGAISREVVRELRARDLLGVFVTPLGIDETTGEDERGSAVLMFEIATTTVSELRTLGRGGRPLSQPVDAAEHARIRLQSPIKPWGGEASEEPREDLLLEQPLEDYALRLSRYPGRQVSVGLAQGADDLEAEVQYLVRERFPLSVFYQVSNTGTDETDNIRHRIGLQYNQLLGTDDVLTFDYITAGFDDSQSLSSFYETSLFGSERLRGRFGGGWSQFTASEVGLAEEAFEGESWFWDLEFSYNVAQRGRFFADLFGGLRYQFIRTENLALPEDEAGEEEIFLPRAGFRLERIAEAVRFNAEVFAEWSENSITSADVDELQALGRLDPDREWVTVQFNSSLSFFLEPLADPEAYANPETWRSSTLAHELYASLAGQISLNDRLIPNAQRVVGGFFSVRGYPEAIVSGDSAVFGTVEYRFHVPRALKPASLREGGGGQDGFLWRPPQVFEIGRAHV